MSLNEDDVDLAGIPIAIHHPKDLLRPRPGQIPVGLQYTHTLVASMGRLVQWSGGLDLHSNL